jgi:hypothetical protein
MTDNKLSKEVEEKLEIARSRVRRIITYTMLGVFSFCIFWGLAWLDPGVNKVICLQAGLQVPVIFFSYWFGERTGKAKAMEELLRKYLNKEDK